MDSFHRPPRNCSGEGFALVRPWLPSNPVNIRCITGWKIIGKCVSRLDEHRMWARCTTVHICSLFSYATSSICTHVFFVTRPFGKFRATSRASCGITLKQWASCTGAKFTSVFKLYCAAALGVFGLSEASASSFHSTFFKPDWEEDKKFISKAWLASFRKDVLVWARTPVRLSCCASRLSRWVRALGFYMYMVN